MGSVEQNIIKQAHANHQPIPDRILNKPGLFEYLRLYYDAWFELDPDRAHRGDYPGCIPWSVTKDYAEFYEFTKEQTEDLFFFIRQLDGTYLKHKAKKTS